MSQNQPGGSNASSPATRWARIERADAKRGARKPYQNAHAAFVKDRKGCPSIDAMRGVEMHLIRYPTMCPHTIVAGQLPISKRLPRPLNHGRGNVGLQLARCKCALLCLRIGATIADMMMAQGRELLRWDLQTKS